MRSYDPYDLRCPQCSFELIRVQRRFVDSLVSVFMPVRRFRCTSLACGFECNQRIRQPKRPLPSLRLGRGKGLAPNRGQTAIAGNKSGGDDGLSLPAAAT